MMGGGARELDRLKRQNLALLLRQWELRAACVTHDISTALRGFSLDRGTVKKALHDALSSQAQLDQISAAIRPALDVPEIGE